MFLKVILYSSRRGSALVALQLMTRRDHCFSAGYSSRVGQWKVSKQRRHVVTVGYRKITRTLVYKDISIRGRMQHLCFDSNKGTTAVTLVTSSGASGHRKLKLEDNRRIGEREERVTSAGSCSG